MKDMVTPRLKNENIGHMCHLERKGGFEKSLLLLPKELWKYPIFGHFLPFFSTFGFFREQKTSFLEPQIFCGSFFYQTPP